MKDESLSHAPVLSQVVSAAADLALVVDKEGVICEVTTGFAIESHPGWKGLVGKRWRDTVRVESQGKVDQLLEQARGMGAHSQRPREVNQKIEGLGDVPFRFSAVGISAARVIALGHDLRPLTVLQQRMVTTQQAMDRDYGRLRQLDTRYRLLFHVTAEGVVIADGNGHRVVEANPAAASMMGEPVASLQAMTLFELFDARSRAAVQALVSAVEAGARPADIQARLHGDVDLEVGVAAFLFRQLGATLVLLRFWPLHAAASTSTRASRALTMLEAMPDGFVVTSESGRILSANTAFFELVQRAGENQVLGENLDRWLGRPGVDLNIIIANLREHRTLKNFSTIVRADFGPAEEALVTAVSALDGKVPCFGFTIRTVTATRLASVVQPGAVTRSAEQLRELVGRVPLKDLVQEAADMIERLCIVAALDVSGNNRASAAQLLGLSRQGLYSKMRRHSLAEFDS